MLKATNKQNHTHKTNSFLSSSRLIKQETPVVLKDDALLH